MSEIFFITSTGTDIGKTFILEKLCHQLIADGKKCRAIKPIISGFDKNDVNSDSAKILRIFNKELKKDNFDQISPWRFKQPLSPNIAADLENKEINFDEVVDFCQKQIKQSQQNNETLFIEGAGGVMTPITNSKTYCDLIANLNIPTILVIGNYVGTISHTLTAITTLKSQKITIDKIILNARDEDLVDYNGNLKSLKEFVPDIKLLLPINLKTAIEK